MTDGLRHSVPSWVVGHDDSDGAAHALAWTLMQARGRSIDVTLVHAWDLPALEFPLPLDDIDALAPRPAFQAVVDAAAKSAPGGVTVNGSLVRGGGTNVLLDAAEGADLLVVGSRGLGGFRRLLLGSVSSQCATHASAPTIVVPASSDLIEVERVVVGFDGSERAESAVRWAANWAPPNADICVLGAWLPPRTGDIAMPQHLTEELERSRSHFRDTLDRVEDGLDRAPFERRFVSGEPSKKLLAEAETADLLVVGQRGLTGFSAAVLGSVATHVVHHATRPVAVIPDPD